MWNQLWQLQIFAISDSCMFWTTVQTLWSWYMQILRMTGPRDCDIWHGVGERWPQRLMPDMASIESEILNGFHLILEGHCLHKLWPIFAALAPNISSLSLNSASRSLLLADQHHSKKAVVLQSIPRLLSLGLPICIVLMLLMLLSTYTTTWVAWVFIKTCSKWYSIPVENFSVSLPSLPLLLLTSLF